MVSIDALMNALPISALEPARVGSISGFVDAPKDQPWLDRTHWLEPPTGDGEPYIDPVQAIETLLHGQGLAADTVPLPTRGDVSWFGDSPGGC